MTWDILICSIEHRADMLDALLAELERQLLPGVGVRVFRDNLETVYGEKCQRLLDSSTADYVSFLDDDDWIAEDFIATIMDALKTGRTMSGSRCSTRSTGTRRSPCSTR
jgi:hypothetical protein